VGRLYLTCGLEAVLGKNPPYGILERAMENVGIIEAQSAPAHYSTTRLPRDAVREAFPPYPRSHWLRFELRCLETSSLTTPHAPVSQARCDFTFTVISNAFAVRERLDDPRDLPYFRYRAFPACR
jgi:hypothetical protein